MGTLLALVILMTVISMPNMGLSWDVDSWESIPPYFLPLFLGSALYSLLIVQPVNYGFHYTTMKAARGDKPDVGDLFDAFKNYGSTILSSIITCVLVIVGFVFLIVPGIIVACKLAFVPLLVVDKKMTAMEAINTSWRMTDGHAFTIFGPCADAVC